MTWRLLLLAATLAACDRPPDPAARDLSRALNPPTTVTDTATQRQASELERCKFVYHDEQGSGSAWS